MRTNINKSTVNSSTPLNSGKSSRKLHRNPNDIFKARALAATAIIKNHMQFNKAVEHIVAEHPEYDNAMSYELIRRVWYGRIADVDLTEILEKMADQYKKAA